MMQKIGIIGAGRLGTALARGLSKAGYDVAISNSRDAASLTLQLSILLPDVSAKDTRELIDWADIVVLALPLRKFTELLGELFDSKIVVDAMNYWSPVDSKLPEFDEYANSSSQLVAQIVPNATVIKTFNSVAYGEIEEMTAGSGDMTSRAMAIAGDDQSSKAIVSRMVEALGFEPVDAGLLENGTRFEPGTTLFDARLSKDQMIDLLKKV
jgi:predicted dinucleotide-binding enzyme